MYVIDARNVNDAYVLGTRYLKEHGVLETSRAGDVLVSPCPVTTAYRNPKERVLFNEARDANPFFHLMESLWMLAGRRNAMFLDLFVKDFSKRFSDDAYGTQHGAYGHRWRNQFNLKHPTLDEDEDFLERTPHRDQLDTIIKLLKANPSDRRVVLQMWHCEIDLDVNSKDIPCNLVALPRIWTKDTGEKMLDLTVIARSNDALWGVYGANVVHFSILQEYLAAMLEVEVGTYYQISNNFHAYVNVFKSKIGGISFTANPYTNPDVKAIPLVSAPGKFMEDLEGFFDLNALTRLYHNYFFEDVAKPMRLIHKHYRDYKNAHDDTQRKESLEAVIHFLKRMPDCDWKRACILWIQRRISLPYVDFGTGS